MNNRITHLIHLSIVAFMLGVFGFSVIKVSSNINTQTNALQKSKAKSIALNEKVQSLTSSKQDIKKYSELSRIAKTVVPADKNQAEAVREIVNIAAVNSISVGSITFPASSLGSSSSSTNIVTTGNKSTLSQLKPVANIPGVYQLTINVTGDPNKPVAYDKFVGFLNGLEKNRRTAQVTSVSINPSNDKPGDISFNLSLNEYIKP